MARARKSNDEEVNLDSLMDALTNVVGILMIVFVLVQLNAAEAVKKILSELPEVTEEQLEELEEQAEEAEQELKKIEEDWQEKEKDMKAVYAELKAAKEEKRRLEETSQANQVNVIDLATLEKEKERLEKAIAAKNQEEESMLQRIEQLEKAIDDTPIYVPPESKVVRLPNPRPLPEGGAEYKFLVSGNKISYINESAYEEQLLAELERVREQSLWQKPPSQPWAKQLADAVGGNQDLARKLWPAFESLASNFQMHDMLAGFGKLHALGFDLGSSKVTQNLAILAGFQKRNLTQLADAFDIFLKDKDPTVKFPGTGAPLLGFFGIHATEPENGKMMLAFGSHRMDVNLANLKQGLMDFVKDVDEERDRKKAYRDRLIYDGKKIVSYLNEQSQRGRLGDRQCATVIRDPAPTSNRLQVEIGLREGGGEGPDDITDAASTFQRAMRKITSEKTAYAWFYVNSDSFGMYLDARNIADEMGTPAGWEPYSQANFVKTIPGMEIVQLEAPKARPPQKADQGPKVIIKGVGKTLD
jgi:Skp family chaperone for outer membrane proteins